MANHSTLKYVELFDLLFSDAAAQHAYELFAQRDPLAGAVTRDRDTNLWRAWQTARREVTNGRPLAAWEALQATAKRYPFDLDADGLAELERVVLIGECLASGHQPAHALEYIDSAQAMLRRFVRRFEHDRAGCAREMRKMAGALSATRIKEATEDDGIVAAWAASRCIDLACDLAKRRARLLSRERADAEAIARDLEDEVRLIEACGGVVADRRIRAKVTFALADVLTETDPKRASEYFEDVVNWLGLEDGRGLHAAINAANCLLRAGRNAEAEDRYRSLVSLFEMRGDQAGAARVWISECVANWKRRRDPDIRDSLVGALKMYEDAIPPGADPMTRYAYKQYAEPGYGLLVAAVAHTADPPDLAKDDLLAAVRALVSRDLLADFRPEEPDDPWEAALAREFRPLAATRTALAPLPGLGVMHLLSATDCPVWVVYGYDTGGRFRFECCARGAEHADRIAAFIGTMHRQMEHDQAEDALPVRQLEQELERLGDAITAELSDSFREAMAGMRTLVYMPQPFGNLSEFPPAGLRIGGAWLGEIVPIIRSPSVTHLRETLSPNRADVRPNRVAVVVLGAPELLGSKLKNVRAEAVTECERLKLFGFDAQVYEAAGAAEMAAWLDGEAGALHYIGHGIANTMFEALPLATGHLFGLVDADRLDGFRVPFLFLCACVAARVRAGAGGYQAGVASKLIERGAPAAVAFSMPVTEGAAYALAEHFYRAAYRNPFGEAVREMLRASAGKVPLYARLAFTGYGDPSFRLTAMPAGPRVPMLQQQLATWHSRLRNHCVLRTADTAAELDAALGTAPADLAGLLRQWLSVALRPAPGPDERLLDAMEAAALVPGLADVERLCVRAAVVAERLHRSGIETIPTYIATDPASIRRLLDSATFLARLGGALFDMRLNGLGNSLRGRVITVDQNDARLAAAALRQGREKLLECEDQSPFVKALRDGDGRILAHFGLEERG